mgnify:CR=1 FL=1
MKLPYKILVLDDDDSALDGIAEAGAQQMVVIDKPTPLWQLFKADLCVRRMNIIWKSGSLQAVCWSTPTVETATHW